MREPSGANPGETQGPMYARWDLLALDSLPPLGRRLAVWRALASAWGEAQCSRGRGHVLPFGTVENSRSHSKPPVDRVTFHLPCLQAQANTRAKIS